MQLTIQVKLIRPRVPSLSWTPVNKKFAGESGQGNQMKTWTAVESWSIGSVRLRASNAPIPPNVLERANKVIK